MSQNAEALQRSCGVTEEEEEDMHEALDSSKRILNHQSSNFLNPDDELLSWLQYPIDDDIFHHWPPPLTTSPAPPASADFLSSFPASFSSSFSVKHLPQLENDAFTAAKDSDRRAAVDDWILQKEDAGSEIFQGEQSTALKNRGIAFAQEGASGVRDYTEAYHFENRGDRRAGIWANRLLDYKQGFAKESGNLAQVVASKGSCQPMHSPSEKAIWLPKEQDTSMMLPTHSTQHEEERGLQREAKAQEEKLLQFGQASNEDCWLKKDMDMDLKTEEQATITGRFQVHSNADAALALGAGRAAGIIQPPGMEAFSKVRTSLQPTQHVPLGSPVSSGFPLSRHLSGKHLFTPAFCNWTAPASRPLGSSGSIPVSQLSYQTGETKLCNAAQRQISRPSAHYSSMGLQENQLNFNEMSKIVKSTLTTATLSETLTTVTLLSPQKIVMPLDRLQDTSIPEETMARGSGSSNAAAASDPGITDMQKLSSVSFLSQERTTGTCSGGSQTSGSLRETVSGIKRKVEDSECVSEEAEEESVVSSQARTSTSKRPRANEVHNLSERKRRNRINDKMNALRELIPNASKSNKAALLDEAIDYLKNLQLQLQVMSLRTGVSLLPMVLPPSMPHMPIPQYVRGTLGMDMSEGSTLASTMSTKDIVKNKTYAAPVRPFSMLGSVSGPLIGNDMRPLRPLAASHSFSQYQAFPSQPLHPHMQAPSQIGFPINSNICNNLHKEQQQQQQTPPTSLQPQERKEEQLQQQHQQQ